MRLNSARCVETGVSMREAMRGVDTGAESIAISSSYTWVVAPSKVLASTGCHEIVKDRELLRIIDESDRLEKRAKWPSETFQATKKGLKVIRTSCLQGNSTASSASANGGLSQQDLVMHMLISDELVQHITLERQLDAA
eukprot:76870-Pleurochrysis_carterae.AAC.3